MFRLLELKKFRQPLHEGLHQSFGGVNRIIHIKRLCETGYRGDPYFFEGWVGVWDCEEGWWCLAVWVCGSVGV